MPPLAGCPCRHLCGKWALGNAAIGVKMSRNWAVLQHCVGMRWDAAGTMYSAPTFKPIAGLSIGNFWGGDAFIEYGND